MSALPRKVTTLAKVLRKLTPPVPLVPQLKRISIVYDQEKHAPARRFVKDTLPRLAYSNAHIYFTVDALPEPAEGQRPDDPEFRLEFADERPPKRISLAGKQPNHILKLLTSEYGVATAAPEEAAPTPEAKRGAEAEAGLQAGLAGDGQGEQTRTTTTKPSLTFGWQPPHQQQQQRAGAAAGRASVFQAPGPDRPAPF